MFIDWLPEVLRPWRSSKQRAKRGARGGFWAPIPVSSNVEQLEALQMLSGSPIDLIARNDYVTNYGGNLTGPSSAPADTIGQDYLTQNHAALGLTAADVNGLIITSQSVSSLSGATYIYYQQTFNGIPVNGAVANVAIAADGSVVAVGNRLIPNLANRINSSPAVISPSTAVILAGNYHGITSSLPPDPIPETPPTGVTAIFNDPARSLDPIQVKQEYSVSSQGDVRLSWNLELHSPVSPDWLEINIDGEVKVQ